MKELKNKISIFLKNHQWAIIVAVTVGFIGVFPHLLFSLELGREYRGIYMMATDNELEYLSRIQEIADGHWQLGSVPFAEYKSAPVFMPPNFLEIGLALTAKLFKVSIGSVVIASKFFLPPVLFFLIYLFVFQLSQGPVVWRRKLNGIVAGLFVTLGYDFVDYHSLWNYFSGITQPSGFLIWTRPINPISGGILVFSFLLIIWHWYRSQGVWYRSQGVKIFDWSVLVSVLILGLAIYSYFFSWGIILAFLGVLSIILFAQKRYDVLKKIFLTFVIGGISGIPYFYHLRVLAKSPDYQLTALRNGLMIGRILIINKILIFGVIILGVMLVMDYFRKQRQGNQNVFKEEWLWFLFTMLGAGFIAFNQQLLTGQAVWPFHFVQYTIPFVIIVLLIAFYNLLGDLTPRFWLAAVSLISLATLSFGIYFQASAYAQNFEGYRNKQRYESLITWINSNLPKDSVVFAPDQDFLGRLIIAFTSSNLYLSDTTGCVVPWQRLVHNYFMTLRLKGVSGEMAENYFKTATDGALYLFGAEGLIYKSAAPSFQKIQKNLVSEYKDFLKKDFWAQLKEYRADYIIIENNQSGLIKELLKNIKPFQQINEFSVYKL